MQKFFFFFKITHLLKNEWVLPNFVRRDGFSQMLSLASNIPAIMTKVAIAKYIICTVSDHITFSLLALCIAGLIFYTIEITFFI